MEVREIEERGEHEDMMADIKHIKELIEEIDLCRELLGGIVDCRVEIVRKDSGREQTISLKDLEGLLEHTSKLMDIVEIECPEWYKEYMERKYGKVERTNNVRGD